MPIQKTRWLFLAGAVLLGLGPVLPAHGQSTSVLGVVPEGVVVDAAPFPDLRPGARIGFRRPDGSAAQVGEGWVLDVREGRALVGLKPGGTVQEGDLAVACASLTGPGSQADLRASVQGLKTQLVSSGGGSGELQTAIAQLESTLDAREAAIRDGSCDVSSHDQEIAALSQQLQQLLAAPPAVAPPPGPGGAPSATSGQETVVAPPPPPEGAPAAVGQDASGSESLATALQFVQQIFQMAQSMGLVGGGAPSGGQQPVAAFPPPDVQPFPPPPMPPTDPGAGPGTGPPFVGTPPPPAPPPVVGTPPPPPPPPTATPPDTPAPGSGGQPPGRRPPVVTRPPGSWWTITPPKQVPPVVGTAPGSSSDATTGGSTPGGITAPGIRPAPGTTKPPTLGTTPHPGLKLPPGTTTPGTGPIVRVPPTTPRMAVVQGIVRADNGAPVPGAVIVVGGKQVATNAQGVFLAGDVPLGRQILVVTARGFVQERLALDLSSGEVERVTLTLRRALGAPLQLP